MLMKPEPLVVAIEALAGPKGPDRTARVVLLSPQGASLTQRQLAEFAGLTDAEAQDLVLVCGRYEGVDQRVVELAIDEEISIGDYVLAGGEVPAMVLIEGVTRLLPGVLGNPDSAKFESFQQGLLEGPQYTRPATFRGRSVPEILLSGDHGAVARWRAERAEETTRSRRPDLANPAKPANSTRRARSEAGVTGSPRSREAPGEKTGTASTPSIPPRRAAISRPSGRATRSAST
jgi:tRNA (guanine37-N1)-methyltransferase